MDVDVHGSLLAQRLHSLQLQAFECGEQSPLLIEDDRRVRLSSTFFEA